MARESSAPFAHSGKLNDGNPDHMPYFFESLFGEIEDEVMSKAARGILISRALFDEEQFKHILKQSHSNLQRFRFHYFFRNIEGLWASTSPVNTSDSRTAGRLYPSPRIKSEEGHRVLELLYCDNCGTTFFGGKRGSPGNQDAFCELLPVSPNIEGIPEKTPAKLVEKRTYQEYAIFWPQGDQDFVPHDRSRGEWPHPHAANWRQLTVGDIDRYQFTAQWVEAYLNKFSGDVAADGYEVQHKPDDWIPGYLFRALRDSNNSDIADTVLGSNRDEHDNLIDTHKALPCTCPACGVNEEHRLKGSSIRGFRTGFSKTTQMFAKELAYQLPDNEKQRKLVVFSDSREDAAQIANGIERNHFTDLLREILIDQLHKELLVKNRIIDALENKRDTEEFERSNLKDLFEEVQDVFEDSLIEKDHPNKRRRARRQAAIEKIDKIKNRTIRVHDLVHLMNTNECAPLIKQVYPAWCKSRRTFDLSSKDSSNRRSLA